MRKLSFLALIFAVISGFAAPASALYVAPSPDLQRSDAAFFLFQGHRHSYLENFEDEPLAAPELWVFTFDRVLFGDLPIRAGVVVRHAAVDGSERANEVGDVQFEAFDEDGLSPARALATRARRSGAGA